MTSASSRDAPSEVDLAEPALTMRDLELLLRSKQLLPRVFSHELVVKTWHNMIAQRAPKIAAFKRQLRVAQREASEVEALAQRLKLALRLVEQAHGCAQQVLKVDAALAELLTEQKLTEQDLKERLREHMQELSEVTWSIIATPGQGEMSRLVWVNGDLQIQAPGEDEASSKQSEGTLGGGGGDGTEHDAPLLKIGAQLLYEEAKERAEELRLLLAADAKLPGKAAEIARLKMEEGKIRKKLAGVVARRERLSIRLMNLTMKSDRLAQVVEHVENNPGTDIFVALDHLERQAHDASRGGKGGRKNARGQRRGDKKGKKPSERVGMEEGDEEEEDVGTVPLTLIAKYRQWTVDLNFEIADNGACELLLDEIQLGLDRLRSSGGETDEDQEASGEDIVAFRDRHQLHRALAHMAEIATKHKAAIRRRLRFQQAVWRKEASKSKVLAEIQSLKRELLQLEEGRAALDAIPSEGQWSGVKGGAAGEARRKAVLESLSSMPEPGLRVLCKHHSLRLPTKGDSFVPTFPDLVSKMFEEELKGMGDKCKELRRAIGITGSAAAGDCDRFELDDVDTNDFGDQHPLLQAGAPPKHGLRARYLALHDEMLQAEREARNQREAETGYRLEWITYHQSLRMRESQSRKRQPLLAMAAARREALRDAFVTAKETVDESKQNLKNLKDEAAKQAKAIKEVEIEAMRYAKSSQHQLSSLRIKLQNIMREVDDVHKHLAVFPGIELGTTTACVRQLRGGDPKSLSTKNIFQLIQKSIGYSEQFLQHVQDGGLSAEPVAPELDKEMQAFIKELMQMLLQEKADVVKELNLPQQAVRKVSLLHRSLHRLQHEVKHNCMHGHMHAHGDAHTLVHVRTCTQRHAQSFVLTLAMVSALAPDKLRRFPLVLHADCGQGSPVAARNYSRAPANYLGRTAPQNAASRHERLFSQEC